MKLYRILLGTIPLLTAMVLLSACNQDDGPTIVGAESYPKATEEGLDAAKLADMVNRITDGEFGQIHSLMIVRNDVVVLAEFFGGFNESSLHSLNSATVSVTSALIGIAIEQAAISGTEANVLDFFPEYAGQIENLTSEKEEMTIEDLLKMSSGLEWDESMFGEQKDDWLKFTLDQPVVFEPGSSFDYSSGAALLLGGILQNSLSRTVEEFAAQNIFGPANILIWSWDGIGREDLPPVHSTAGGLSLRTIGMANFGLLYLNRGVRNGEQILPRAWIEASTERRLVADEAFDFAYQWWRFSDNSEIGRLLSVNDLYFAWGAGGQFIFVIPHLNMVVVSTAGNFQNPGTPTFDIMKDFILPSVQE